MPTSTCLSLLVASTGCDTATGAMLSRVAHPSVQRNAKVVPVAHTADSGAAPLLEIGKYQSFNVNSRNTLTLNTGFVDQDYDETIEDILMSEYVAVYTNSNWVSVVPNRGTIEYQKSVNTKLINYTMSFDFGFDERSLVR